MTRLLIIVLALSAFFLLGCIDQNIRTFEECEDAGYPIMESYPRQCRTPDGRTFVNQFEAFLANKNTLCISDTDCILADSSLGFSCCYLGACREIDYSNDTWTSVNKEWFEKGKHDLCLTPEECGPAPMCAIRVKNDSFKAACINENCIKISDE